MKKQTIYYDLKTRKIDHFTTFINNHDLTAFIILAIINVLGLVIVQSI